MSQQVSQPSDATQIFSVLADDRRRRLLAYLRDKDGDVASFADLIDHLLVREADSADALDADGVAISLHHVHLPKLADADLVEYDTQSRTVRYIGRGVAEERLGANPITGRE